MHFIMLRLVSSKSGFYLSSLGNQQNNLLLQHTHLYNIIQLHFQLTPYLFNNELQAVQMDNRSNRISIREAQKKYTDAIAKMKSTKDPAFITFKYESKPQHIANQLSGHHPLSSMGYIVQYEKNGIPYIQVVVTEEGTPINNIEYIE